MPDSSSDHKTLLDKASAQAGMDSGYWDIWGKWHQTPDEVRRAILISLGWRCETEEALREELRRRAGGDHRIAPPTIVASHASQPVEIELALPEGRQNALVTIRVVEESGEIHETRVDAVDGRIRLPGVRSLGYHEAEFSVEGSPELTCTSRLILCPDRAWFPPSLERGGRRAGLAVSLYGVHGKHTWGCGDFTALERVIDWVADHIGGAYVALNPLSDIHNRQPFNTSPYLPNSVFYRNFIYLNLDRVPDFAHSPQAHSLRQHPRIVAEIAELNDSEFVEYERVATLKRTFLRLLFRAFYHREYLPGTKRGQAFRKWVEQEGELLRKFALFAALEQHFHRSDPDVWIWQQWPAEYQDPNSEAVARFAADHPRSLLFTMYVQWLLDQQAAEAQRHARARGLEIGLFHDLPLATDRWGFDLWASRRFYVDGCRVGSPPDDFSPSGQDWSFPPPNSEAHFQDGYRLFAASIRKSARHGGALRIDHVMRLFRLYWIPDGFDAASGTYVRDRSEDLLRVLALESHRQKVLIVGEDLGTVEPYMREALEDFGILSYRLFYFEKNERNEFKRPHEYPVQALVSSTTHDLPTLAGFWIGRDIEARAAAGLVDEAGAARQRADRAAEKQRMLDVLFELRLLPDYYPRRASNLPELTGEMHNAVTGFLASTPCLLLTLNHEDLTKETDQQNLPGTTWQYPNWRRKMGFSVEDLRSSQTALDFAAMFRHWLGKEGRAGV
jgi:4-alpha-glucanotransferase